MTKATQQSRYRVEGMDCASCATKIDRALRHLPGIEDVSVSVTAGTMTVRHDRGTAPVPAIAERVGRLGYKVIPILQERPDLPPACETACPSCDHVSASAGQGEASAADLPSLDRGPAAKPWWKSAKGCVAVASGTAFAVAWLTGKFAPGLESWIFTAATLVGLVPIARRATMAALAKMPFSIEMLMTIAATGAIIIGASEEAAAVVFLFLIGELLEGVSAGKARASIQSLTDLVPRTALLDDGAKIREVQASHLKVGATILVRPGDRISADGVILSGESAIDEAPVTGESTPVRKGVDATVFAGTVNGDAALRIRVTATAADNTIARVVKLVEEAQESKAPTERFIDRFSRYYTPAILLAGALIGVVPPLLLGGDWSAWIYKGLAILLIGCPCALVISTPAAIAASLSAGARRGLLLKGGAVLEKLGKVTVVTLDKTGTLTAGKPQVTDVIGFGQTEADVLRLAAALETGSSHPLAKAILDRAVSEDIAIPQATDTKAIGGKGITGIVDGAEVFLGSPQAAADRVALSAEEDAQIATFHDAGKTVAVLAAAGRIAGALAMRDEPRPDAKSGLKALAHAGIKTMMLTGDNYRTAQAIGQQLEIEIRAELLPENKRQIVGELKKQGFLVAKVGDGINDAPALAAADVGIAMGGGTDVALETADAAILHGRIADIAEMIELSKRTMTNIRQNITIALGLKGVFLITTIIGITGLWPAILADTGATVLVTMNALRLLGTGRAS